jgi:uncharacterized protein (DUF1697 family)
MQGIINFINAKFTQILAYMMVYVTFLRCVNESGQKKLSMTELHSVLEKMEVSNVQTYIQSGNVAFRSNKEDHGELEKHLGSAILCLWF